MATSTRVLRGSGPVETTHPHGRKILAVEHLFCLVFGATRVVAWSPTGARRTKGPAVVAAIRVWLNSTGMSAG